MIDAVVCLSPILIDDVGFVCSRWLFFSLYCFDAMASSAKADANSSANSNVLMTLH